jgi:AcrR family transcriptional regulator
MSAPPSAGTRRERVRAATIEEIKSTALELIRESGAVDVRFTDIARRMGMTPPALYRYFADRDALLTELIADAYHDLAEDLAAAREMAGDDFGARLLAAGEAYRAWARREPQQFALIFGLPIPGYAPPPDGPTKEAATRAFTRLESLFLEAHAAGELGPPYLTEVEPTLEVCLMSDVKGGTTLPTASFQAMMHAWAGLHGFTSLEAYGHLDWMPKEARDALFRSQIRLIARTAGLPEA